jgi:hypothetical protein
VPSGFSNTAILIVHVHVYEYAYVDEEAGLQATDSLFLHIVGDLCG